MTYGFYYERLNVRKETGTKPEFETGNFMKLYHENLFLSFVNTLYNGKNLAMTILRNC